jgi:lysophospholipase L1-like esterase
MRILIVTDSLGIPREGLNVDDVWVFRLIEYFRHKHQIITHLQPGLSSGDILRLRENLFEMYKPNLVIFQIGIVDCCRRAMPKDFLKIISKFNALSKIIHRFVKKYHYELTKFFNIHYVDLAEFRKFLSYVQNVADSNSIKIVFIAIAPPGRALKINTFSIVKDVQEYNESIRKAAGERVLYLNPYASFDALTFLNEDDGHHLNKRGNDLVYEELKKQIRMLTSNC